MEKLVQVLSGLRPDVDFINNNKLIDDGIIDSFDIITLVGELNENFDIEIGVEDLVPENFNSATAMMRLIERLQNGD
jgi:D-alanine--poly(phosphoribitol) ligase subunit 2